MLELIITFLFLALFLASPLFSKEEQIQGCVGDKQRLHTTLTPCEKGRVAEFWVLSDASPFANALNVLCSV